MAPALGKALALGKAAAAFLLSPKRLEVLVQWLW
jgi:hypothetical protein